MTSVVHSIVDED